MIDFTPLIKSEVAISHFARLCGSNRISVRKWMNGTTVPRKLYREAVDRQLARLARAVERGTLPLPDTRREDKYEAVVRALKG